MDKTPVVGCIHPRISPSDKKELQPLFRRLKHQTQDDWNIKSAKESDPKETSMKDHTKETNTEKERDCHEHQP